MRRFVCDLCGGELAFEHVACPSCRTPLGLFAETGELKPLHGLGVATYVAVGSAGADPYWRCLNAAWGCNWMTRCADSESWCPSCRLTRGRPDEEHPAAVAAWAGAEAGKRRVVSQLRSLRLPLQAPMYDGDDGVAVDFVHLPDEPGLTGYRPGVITIDLRDFDGHFDSHRAVLGEADRTVIGRLRHEFGHHYFSRLVGDGPARKQFSALFGGQRFLDATAVRPHHGHPSLRASGAPDTACAPADACEDWAATFAHYLVIRDGLETAAEYNLAAHAEDSMSAMLRSWARVSSAMNELNRGVGHVPAYPFTITPSIEAKLDFVHRMIRRATRGPVAVPNPA